MSKKESSDFNNFFLFWLGWVCVCMYVDGDMLEEEEEKDSNFDAKEEVSWVK